MSLEIKTQQPISVILPVPDVTLAGLQTIIPEITELVAVYSDRIYGAFSGGYIYRVLVPYTFSAPRTAGAYGDHFTVAYLHPSSIDGSGRTVVTYDNETSPSDIPAALLAQDTVYIYIYEK